MKLYYFPIAPNPTRLRLYLAEKAAGGAVLELEQQLVDLRAGEQRKPEHLARNPLGKLPVLELADGSFLTESLAIIEFLEELHPEPALIGRTPETRARVREIERVAELAVLQPIARVLHGTKSPLGLPPAPEVAAHARAVLPDGLAVLEARLSDGRPFLAGETVSIADCTLAAGFQFARFGGVALPGPLPHLERWDRAYRARARAQRAGGLMPVRPATSEDLPELSRLFDAYRVFYRQASDRAGAEHFLRERSARGDSFVFVAEREGGGLAGFTQLYPSLSSVSMARIFVLNDLFVDPDVRKSGVGRALLAAAHDFARSQGAVRVSLETARDNVTAQRLYEALGYERDSVFHRYHRRIA